MNVKTNPSHELDPSSFAWDSPVHLNQLELAHQSEVKQLASNDHIFLSTSQIRFIKLYMSLVPSKDTEHRYSKYTNSSFRPSAPTPQPYSKHPCPLIQTLVRWRPLTLGSSCLTSSIQKTELTVSQLPLTHYFQSTLKFNRSLSFRMLHQQCLRVIWNYLELPDSLQGAFHPDFSCIRSRAVKSTDWSLLQCKSTLQV